MKFETEWYENSENRFNNNIEKPRNGEEKKETRSGQQKAGRLNGKHKKAEKAYTDTKHRQIELL